MSVLLAIDRRDAPPIWRQIVRGVTRLVDEGTLAPGSRLPPTRRFAATLGVNRSTVYRAYQELWAAGYLEARPGSYSTVRARTRPLTPERAGAPGLVDWAKASGRGAALAWEAFRRLPRRPADRRAVDLASLSMDHDLCPAEEFRRAVRRVLLDAGRALLDYGDPAGHRPLRESIARRMRVHGVRATAEEVLVTSGAQQALDLVARLFARPGAAVAVERPTYGLALPIFRAVGLRVREIPVREDGLDLDRLERAAARRAPAFLYTMPNFHNPTGITTSQPHRERLLDIGERHRMPIVEDGFEEEMKYGGRAVLPVKSMDRHGVVLYLGTFSKVLFPGLRVGWIAAERGCIERLLAVKRFTTLSGENLAQAALARFCEEGAYEAHLRRIHAVHRRRMQALLRGLAAHLDPAGAVWTEPVGGYTLWLEVRRAPATREGRLVELAAAEGVAVVGGSHFFAGAPPGLFLRLSIACAREERIDAGCRALARAIGRLGPRGGRP